MSEHGWNDPPVLNYTSLQSGVSKRTQLTKRVNHELPPSQPYQSVSKPPNTVDVSHTVSAPPIGAKRPPPPLSKIENSPEAISDKDAAGRVVEELESVQCPVMFGTVIDDLRRVVEKHSESLQNRTQDEIKRRLQLLSNQWREGKLSAHVQEEMAKLSSAMENGDYITADKIHVSLMVDHVSEVSQWMVGVKRLIATLKQQQHQSDST